jgi:hypothetical protein
MALINQAGAWLSPHTLLKGAVPPVVLTPENNRANPRDHNHDPETGQGQR